MKLGEIEVSEKTEKTATVVAVIVSAMQRLIGLLVGFAEKYVPLELPKDGGDEIVAYLRETEGPRNRVKKNPGAYVSKEAERTANEYDRTVRPAAKQAKTLLFGEAWERVLAEKDWDLCQLLQGVVSNIGRIDAAVTGDNPFVHAYRDILAERLELIVNGCERALAATYKGACWYAFNAVRKNASRTVSQIAEIEVGNVPAEILETAKRWAAEKKVA